METIFLTFLPWKIPCVLGMKHFWIICLLYPKIRNSGILEIRKSGFPEFRNSGIPGFRYCVRLTHQPIPDKMLTKGYSKAIPSPRPENHFFMFYLFSTITVAQRAFPHLVIRWLRCSLSLSEESGNP